MKSIPMELIVVLWRAKTYQEGAVINDFFWKPEENKTGMPSLAHDDLDYFCSGMPEPNAETMAFYDEKKTLWSVQALPGVEFGFFQKFIIP